jgi:hypothetical protein
VTVSSPRGHVLVKTPSLPGRWRLRWSPAGGADTFFSRDAAAARR